MESISSEVNKGAYKLAKSRSKRVVAKAQDEVRQRYCNMLVEEDGKGNVFRVAKQMVGLNKDITASGCVKGADGRTIVEEEKIMQRWKEYYERLLNDEGPSGVAADMLKAAGEAGVKWVTDICNEVVSSGEIPVDWKRSWMVYVYKGKRNALECSSYRGIKLLEHVLKVLERVIEARVRGMVKLEEMHF